MSVQIQFVESYRDVPGELWSQCFGSHLESLFWYRTLEDCGIKDQFLFDYALIIKDGKNVGVAPAFVHNVPMSLVAPPSLDRILQVLARFVPQAGYQRTYFVGSPCAEEGTIGLLPGVPLSEVILPLADAVKKRARHFKAPMIVFKDQPDSVSSALDKLCHGQKYFRIVSYPGTEIHLAGTKIDDYFADLSRTRRHNFRKKLRRSKEILELDTIVKERPDDAELDEIFGLFMQTYERGKTKFEKLSIEFFRLIRDADQSLFLLQREKSSGKLVTFMLLFHLGDRMVNKFIGLDYSRGPSVFLYFRQFEAALNLAYERGCSVLQSGQTGYRAKLDLGNKLMPLNNYCLHTSPLFNLIYTRLSGDITLSTLDDDLALYLANHREKAGLEEKGGEIGEEKTAGKADLKTEETVRR